MYLYNSTFKLFVRDFVVTFKCRIPNFNTTLPHSQIVSVNLTQDIKIKTMLVFTEVHTNNT